MVRYWFIGMFCFVFSAFSQQDGIWLHPNLGQWDKEILHKIDLVNGEMYVSSTGFTYVLSDFNDLHSHDPQSKEEHEEKETIAYHILKSEFIGTSWGGKLKQENLSGFYRNYFLGSDPKKWQSAVHSYQKVTLQEYYPGIDLKIEGLSQNLKYSFVAQPSADISAIKYRISGSDKIKLDEGGNLHIATRFGEIIELHPIAWNESEEKKTPVEMRFKLDGNVVSFEFPKGYNHQQVLVLDPTLTFSTFSGSTLDNWGMTATPDLNGNLYAGGIVFTGTGSYPTTAGAFDVSYNGGTSFTYQLNGLTYNTQGFDIAISKFNATGTTLLYSTYIGGSGNEAPHSLVTDNNGDLYILGVTSSSNFPVTASAYDNSFNGGPYIAENELGYNDGADIYVAHLNANGTAMIGATYVGGSGTDGVNIGALNYNYGDPFRGEIIVDNSGAVYVSSTTQSSNFPTVNAAQGTLQGTQDAVLFKMNTNLTNMLWSTYLGGAGNETGNSVQIGTNGFVYMTGGTNSNTLPFTTGEDLSFNGGVADGYVARFNSGTGALNAGTFMGLNEYDQAYFVQLDQANEVYIYGQTESAWTISPGLYGNPNSGQFIRKYNTNLTSALWTTMIGAGSGHVEISPTAFLVSNCYDIYIAGWGGQINSDYSNQADYSTTNGFAVTADAYQTTTNGSNFFIALLGQDASQLKYATFMGGASSSYNHVDGGTSRFDKNGKIYHAVCAACGGQDFGFTTTPGVYSPTNNSTNCNLAAFKFELSTIEGIVTVPETYICIPNPTVFTNNSTNGDTYFWDFGDGTTSNQQSPTHSYTNPGTFDVMLVVSDANGCFSPDTVTFQVEIGDFNGGAVQPTTPICKGVAYQLEAYGGSTYSWTPTEFLNNPNSATPIATIDETTDFTVIVSDSCGTDTITITLEVYDNIPIVSNDTSLCIGGSAQLFVTGGASQIWSPGATLNNPNSATPIATPSSTTTYIVEVTTPENCVFTDSVIVQVFYDSPAPDIPDTVKLCNGDTVNIKVGGAETYTWSPNQFINTTTGDSVWVHPPQDMYYFCDFTNACGTVRDSVFMKIQIPVITAGNDTTICPGDYANVWASGGVSYQWFPSNTVTNPNAAITTVHPNTPLIYYVLGTDQYGCVDTGFVHIDLFPQILVQASPDVHAFMGDVVPLSATGTVSGIYTWYPPEYLSCVTCVSPSANPDKNFTYTVTLTDANGCSASDEVTIFYDGIIYVPNTFTPDNNNFNNAFQAIGGNIYTFEMNIFNRWGEIIFTATSLNQAWDGTYNGLPCPIGTYTWKIHYTDFNDHEENLVGHVNLVR